MPTSPSRLFSGARAFARARNRRRNFELRVSFRLKSLESGRKSLFLTTSSSKYIAFSHLAVPTLRLNRLKSGL
jgi:hypothetical protein